MKITNLFILFFFLSIGSMAQTQPEIKAFTTGKLFGNVIRVEITNNTNDEFTLRLNPFYFPFVNKNQGYVIPGAHIFTVRAGESASFYLQGYGTDMGKKLVEADAEIPWQIIEKLNKIRVLPYDSLIPLLPEYKVQTMTDAELIPFDFIVTHPGTHDPLAYYFDTEQKYELSQSLLINEVMRLENAYTRLKTAGKLVTHFNNDAVYERKTIMQLAVWITASGLKGVAVKTPDLKNAIFDFYKTAGGEQNRKEFNKSYSRYHNILKTLGQEARVYTVPEDMDKAPACLPQIVGFQPTHKAVKTPAVATKRFETYPVRNQRFLNENDCLPCKASNSVSQLLKIFILKQQLNIQLSNLLNKTSFANFSTNEPEAFALIKKLFETDPAQWLNPVNFNKKPEALIFQNYFESQIEELAQFIPANPETDLVRSFFDKAKQVSSLLLLLYQNNDLEFSLDCCDNDHKPTPDQFRMAGLLSDLSAGAGYFESIVEKNNSNTLITAFATKAVVADLLKLFTFQTKNRQYISVGESLPVGETPGNFLEEFYKIHIGYQGEMQNGRYILPADSQQKLIFIFDTYNCGKYRESTLPFLIKKPGTINLADASHISKIRLDHKMEFSGYFGQRWMNATDASRYNGGTLTQIEGQLKKYGFDTLMEKFYNTGYYFTGASGFKFTNVIDYSFAFGYEIFNNFQIRVNAGSSRGFVEGYLPVHYLEDLSDPSTLTYRNLLIRSKFNAVYGGLGFRYYYGIRYKPFAGASFQYSRHDNNSVVLYSEFAEIQMLPSQKVNTTRFSFDLGLRYQVNQDFFIETGGKLIERNTYSSSGFARDFAVFGGAGLRF